MLQASTPTKPVMDVAAPKNPASVSVPTFAPRPMAATAAATPLPVRPAPLATTVAPSPQPVVPAEPLPLHARPIATKRPAPLPPARRAPVALITVTVFVMLVLSALAVTVYMTSQTA